MTNVVILGSGTAGTMMANKLARTYRERLRRGTMRITLVDRDNSHVYQPGLLFLPFGMTTAQRLVRPRATFVPKGVEYVVGDIDRVSPNDDRVHLTNGTTLDYDALIVATGTQVAPQDTEGLTGSGWGEKMFEFYTLEGADALRKRLATWRGGRLVLNVVDMPIKCPVAPLEFVFLADFFFTTRGIRDGVDITYVTPLDGAFTKPIAANRMGHLLDQKSIRLVSEFSTGEVDGPGGRLVSWDEREVAFDLLVTVPLHRGAAFIGRSDGLGNDMDFVFTDQRTLQAKRRENIFAMGDATDLPTSKTGSVAHFQAEVLVENLGRFLAGKVLEPAFDGHVNCFVETGFHKAMLLDFNYDVEPLPGKFPFPVLGPMALLNESRLNHWGKLGFEWLYWNILMRGRGVPAITTHLTMKGKSRKPARAVPEAATA
jgi:sulfide:quinone oxidoreductase